MVPAAGVDGGHRELAMVPPCLCCAAPSAALVRKCSASEPEATSGGWCLGFSMGKVALRELRSCQAQATPSVPVFACACACVCVDVCRCSCGLMCMCLLVLQVSVSICVCVSVDVREGGCL